MFSFFKALIPDRLDGMMIETIPFSKQYTIFHIKKKDNKKKKLTQFKFDGRMQRNGLIGIEHLNPGDCIRIEFDDLHCLGNLCCNSETPAIEFEIEVSQIFPHFWFSAQRI